MHLVGNGSNFGALFSLKEWVQKRATLFSWAEITNSRGGTVDSHSLRTGMYQGLEVPFVCPLMVGRLEGFFLSFFLFIYIPFC
ncbi:hypothetical protein HanXRQr2_Chr09g0393711 [Helianthus annuus]|nr:hypothetical protein HanXRQr2_Chr09g0393711 [Helianthus annuus]